MVAITCALFDEVYEITRLLKQTKINGVPHYIGKIFDKDVSLFLTKPGLKKKGLLLRWLKLYKFDFVIHTGFAGALQPGFEIGQLCDIERVLHADYTEHFQVSHTQNSKTKQHIITANKPIITIDEKEDLAHSKNATFVDMELWNLYNLFKENNINTPIVPIKIIGDLVAEDDFLEKEIIFRPYFSSWSWKTKLKILFSLRTHFIPLYKRKRFLQKTLLSCLKNHLNHLPQS